MRLRTEYIPKKAEESLDIHRRMLFLGSCFSQNIGSRLSQRGWDVAVNPCGVLYNPLSIVSLIRLALSGVEPDIKYDEVSGRWFSWDFSTLFSHSDKARAKELMNKGLQAMKEYIQSSQAVVITLGTSYVFRHLAEDRVVANCHKFPADTFQRYIVSIEEIMQQLRSAIALMRKYNPDLRVIYTVSPVRHIADGFQGNMNSKARLLIACEALTDDALVEYFPAYEIVNDDLRDYRFYEADMIHPSAVAADYILEKFLDRYVSERDKQILAQGEKIYRRLAHRNMATDAESTINRFNDETEALVKSFMAANPGMCFPTL